MRLIEEAFTLPGRPGHTGLLEHLDREVRARLGSARAPIRCVITATDSDRYACELGVLDGHDAAPIFRLRRRARTAEQALNVVLVVPTGIGCAIGGHAGDATPVARLLATVCDTLVTHPNVVNASDLNALPANGLYVEGSVLARLLMGTAGLARVRANRVLVVADAHPDPMIAHILANSVNAARATLGADIPEIVTLDPPLALVAERSPAGRAAGRVEGIDRLLELLLARRGTFDAVAVATRVAVDDALRAAYYRSHGEIVNPWGGVEALLTHAVSSLLDVPAAHAPMLDSGSMTSIDWGVVDPRMAAEAISTGFLLCTLQGLRAAPRIVADGDDASLLTARDIGCLVIPDGCIGLPTLAALEQGIMVIAVRENVNVMRNDLTALPWKRGQLHVVENYWEAAGVLASLRAGVAPASTRRPLPPVPVRAG